MRRVEISLGFSPARHHGPSFCAALVTALLLAGIVVGGLAVLVQLAERAS